MRGRSLSFFLLSFFVLMVPVVLLSFPSRAARFSLQVSFRYPSAFPIDGIVSILLAPAVKRSSGIERAHAKLAKKPISEMNMTAAKFTEQSAGC